MAGLFLLIAPKITIMITANKGIMIYLKKIPFTDETSICLLELIFFLGECKYS